MFYFYGKRLKVVIYSRALDHYFRHGFFSDFGAEEMTSRLVLHLVLNDAPPVRLIGFAPPGEKLHSSPQQKFPLRISKDWPLSALTIGRHEQLGAPLHPKF